MDFRVEIAGLGRARRKKRAFDRIIGCYDPDTRKNHFIRFHRADAPDMLVLRFVDLDTPPPPPHDERPELRMPTLEEIRQALEFDRPGDRLLVHCRAGISRSSAVALAIIASRLGPGREEEAIRAVYSIRPEAVPNLAVLGHADSILRTRLCDALRAVEENNPAARLRRQENREAYLNFYGCSPKPV